MPSALPVGLSWPDNFVLQPLTIAEKSFHAYVHIPFCTVRCGYCDFNTYAPKETDADQATFDQALITEIKRSEKFLEQSGLKVPALKSVFVGGGTPSLLTSKQFASILSELRQTFGFADDIEITTEANPESTTTEVLAELRKLGVNRLSLGVQSFDTEVLRVLDRTHTEQKVFELVPQALELGFEVSVDLIYGAPGETLNSWKSTVKKALELGTQHISAYSLIVEPGTKLERKIRRGELESIDEDLNAAKHEYASQSFEEAGLVWYEVSNWGKPSVHNSAYWQSQNWWGYGPGAHSHLFGNRFWNVKNPTAYQQKLENGLAVAGREELTSRQQLEEQLMLGVRTSGGVSRELFGELGIPGHLVASAIAAGLLVTDAKSVRVTSNGRLLVDRLVVDFLSPSEEIV